jgi:hypothetical protein
MQLGEHLTKFMESTEDDALERELLFYRSAVGSLLYLAVGTRPDISAAVGVVSRFMENPSGQHWKAVKKIFRYLKGTADHALCLGGDTSGAVVLSGYCDADWAGDHDDRHSTTGYAFSLGSGSISWSSKRQKTVALSTTEAEYMAVSAASREAVWLRQLLGELGCFQERPTVLFNDNQGCIKLSKNPVFHTNSKHIDVQHHYVRELQEAGAIELQYCASEEMVADVLTKALARDAHVKCSRNLGVKGQRLKALSP